MLTSRKLRTAAIAATAAGMLMTGAVAAGATEMGGNSVGSWHAYAESDWTGADKDFSGNTGDCNYVGAGWNDHIRSARANGDNVKVELWDNADCTGGSITIDGGGYHSIGDWVSAYRVTS
ncbi:peptidase inhibitor family I36 protein [Streptomyces sp. NPDC059009]|uniref:peptidase inhibitor family I36 protein n=1 Tax=Streptomyces sp. NPDC059009 TaxID=3346694 RepID=UPI0036A142F4